jgi:hypothetical protein
MVNWSNLETFLELVAFFTLLSSLFIHWKNIAFSNNFNFSIVGRWLLSISNISIFIIYVILLHSIDCTYNHYHIPYNFSNNI